MNRALDANVPAITTGGIYPGISNGAYLSIRIVLLFPNKNQNYYENHLITKLGEVVIYVERESFCICCILVANTSYNFVIVMAAELVRAASESEDKPERLRLVDPLIIPKFMISLFKCKCKCIFGWYVIAYLTSWIYHNMLNSLIC